VEAAGEYRGGASTAALVICIIIAVVGVGLAFVFYNKWDAQQNKIDEQGEQLTELGDQVKSLTAELEQWKGQSGFDTHQALTTALDVVPEAAPATAKRVLELLDDQAREARLLAQEMEGNYQKAVEELKNLQQQLQQTVAAKDAEIQRVDEERAQTEVGYKQEIQKRDQQITQLQEVKRTAEDAAQQAQDQLEEVGVDFRRQLLRQEASVAQMREKLRVIQEKIQEPDGYMVAFDNESGYGTINLGRIDHVQNGMIFLVYSLGRGGQVLDKGRVQVRRVAERSSEVGIIESVPDRPVTRGDYVMSPLQAKTKPVFVIAGWFPPSLGYSVDELAFLVERWGGRVDKEVTLDTDYLVVGKIRAEGAEASPEAQKVAEQGLQAYNLARELAVRIVDVEDFLKLVQR